MLSINIKKTIGTGKGKRSLQVSAQVEENTIAAVYGSSGIGKTTLFNCIAGLIRPDEGAILFEETPWFHVDTGFSIPTQKRNVGYIFQGNSLFPHFNVTQNILFGVKKEDREEVDVSQLLSSVEMSGTELRYPRELSGGQIQRIAIARALAQKSRLILMDEPFSALDFEIKQKLFQLVKNFKDEYHLTIIVITHDVNDILQLCDHVLWIKEHQANGILTTSDFRKELELNQLKGSSSEH